MKELIPGSIEAFEHLDELYVDGQNKFNQELMFAKSIPPGQRRLIDKNYLQTIDMPSHENAN